MTRPSVYKRLQRQAETEGVSLSDVVRRIILEHFARIEAAKKGLSR